MRLVTDSLSLLILLVLTLASLSGLAVPTGQSQPSGNHRTISESTSVIRTRARYEDGGPPGICSKWPYQRGRTRRPTYMGWRQCRAEHGLGWLYEGHCYGMTGATHPRARIQVRGKCYFSNTMWPLPIPSPPSPDLPPASPPSSTPPSIEI
ncbi:hypothetical protein Hypma_005167 [Hypsizygus marmoreus]|uniref:CBM1 domain-containing protein n=1 Tax=Hypsizygus marmoreus TaxID=39966 RepID=A0A369K2C4_HYPMA|nr:hypothetical protein Hypma_005167 [Hypsizygus marmoreus]